MMREMRRFNYRTHHNIIYQFTINIKKRRKMLN